MTVTVDSDGKPLSQLFTVVGHEPIHMYGEIVSSNNFSLFVFQRFILCTRENSDASRLVVWWIRVRTLANPPVPIWGSRGGGPVGGEVQSIATPLVLEIGSEGFPGGVWKRGSTRVWK